MSEEIKADIAKADDPFALLEKDTLPESPTEKEPVKEEEIPFHKHPRWIEKQREIEELRSREEETARELAELKTFKAEIEPKISNLQPVVSKIPDWFVELYGENQSAWSKYEMHEQAKEQEMERRVIERQAATQRQQSEQMAYWERRNNQEMDKLAANGKEFDRNELAQTMIKYQPIDANGLFDFEKGYEIYEAFKKKPDPAHALARKTLADTTTKTTTAGERKKDYKTAHDLRGKPW